MFKITQNQKKNIFIGLFFLIVILALQAPFASNDYLRDTVSDINIHTSLVAQAKVALDEGQFPPRLALQDKELGTAWFQFYGPVFFTVSGLVHKFFFPDNSYAALKFVLWSLLFLGVLFFYLFIKILIKSDIIAVASALIYLMSPYLLLNIFERGAITEVAGQALIPILLYLNFKVLFSKKLEFVSIIFAAIFWFCLLGTHVITFFYFSFFLGVFLLCFAYLYKDFIRNILFIGTGYVYGLLLSAYYLIPIKMFLGMTFMKYGGYTTLFKSYFCLTPLSSLLSLVPTTPVPLSNPHLVFSPRMYLAIGLPVILGIIGIFYVFFIKKQKCDHMLKRIIVVFLGLFFVAFFLAWTPFDLWIFIPKFFQVAQFNYRFLAQINWIGALLFAFCLYFFTYNKHVKIQHAVIGIFCFCLLTRQWVTFKHSKNNLHFQENTTQYTIDPEHSIFIKDLMKKPNFGYGQKDYLFVPEAVGALSPSTASIYDAANDCKKIKSKTICHIIQNQIDARFIQIPVFYYSSMQKVTVNGYAVHFFPIQAPMPIKDMYSSSGVTLVGLNLPKGDYTVQVEFRGIIWANWISIFGFCLALIFLLFHLYCSLVYKKTK